VTPQTAESALVILVPEAEPVVKALRDRHDPSAAAGAPAHITLLYPFKPPDEIEQPDIARLQHCAGAVGPFDFSLAVTRRFPGVLYFAPEPDESFRRLTATIWSAYPETPPYRGQYQAIVPHLTVAQVADERQLDAVAAALQRASAGKLPIAARASEMALLDTVSGRWEVRRLFKLG
jgi:2'-5' RNA ligase